MFVLILFPIKISFEICSKQLLTMRNRFLILPKPEKLNFNEFSRFKVLKTDENIIRFLCFKVCESFNIVSFVVKSPSGSKNQWKTADANPRRSLFEKCFKSWFDTVRWWEMSCAFEIFRNYWLGCFLRRVMVILRQQKNIGPNVRYCVLDIMKTIFLTL